MVFKFFDNKNKNDYYLGIFLKEEKGTLILMKKEKDEILIEDKIDFYYTNSWENLVEDIDENLYQLEKKHQITLSKTIFFLYSYFIDQDKKNIKLPYLEKIKKVVKDLNLEVLGYIDTVEAIYFYFKEKENNLFTGIIVEVDMTQIGVFVYQGDKLVSKSFLPKTDSIVDDFIFSVSELKEKNIILPSKIIIYDSDNIDKKLEELINYQWGKDYFIENPKFEIIKEKELIEILTKTFYKNLVKEKDDFQLQEKNSEENFGFVIGEDVSKVKTKDYKKNIFYQLFSFYFSKVKINFDFFKFRFSFFDNSRLLIFLGFIVFVCGLFINEYFFHKAFLKIYLPSKKIEKELKIDIDEKISTVSAKFFEDLSTTGKKEIGTKARGSVVVHNFDDKELFFPKGTVIENSSLKFLFENDIKVASSSLLPDASAKIPGKKEVEVIAENIGSESNLPQGSRFKISGFSENLCFAINEKPFVGGSKKQIKTVSYQDINNLEKKIIEKAKKHNFNLKLKNENVLKTLTEYRFVKKKFSKELGEEAENVSLEAEIEASFYTYSKDKVKKILVDDIKKDLTDDFYISEKNINFEVIDVKKKNKKIEITLKVKGKFNIFFDEKKALSLIIGKNKNELEKILKSNFKIKGYALKIDYWLPFFNNFLPFFKKNIDLKIFSL